MVTTVFIFIILLPPPPSLSLSPRLPACLSLSLSLRSYGVFLYELVTNGSVPYASFNNQQVRSKVTEGYRLPQPHNCPDELYSLMFQCWLPRATERPKFDDVIHNHLDPLKVKANEGRLTRQNSTSTSEDDGKRCAHTHTHYSLTLSLTHAHTPLFYSPSPPPTLSLSQLNSQVPSRQYQWRQWSQTESERAALPSGVGQGWRSPANVHGSHLSLPPSHDDRVREEDNSCGGCADRPGQVRQVGT